MPEPLTKLERRILDFVVDYLRRNTYQPSIREIGRRFDIKSTKTVSEHLQSLADKGWIERDPSRSRGVRLWGLDLLGEAVRVPVYPGVAPVGGAFTGVEPSEWLRLDRKLAGASGSFCVTMVGDSMAGEAILDGDLLVVGGAERDELEPGDIVVARLRGELVVKRYFPRGGEAVLEPANPDYAPILVHKGDDFVVLGRVLGVYRRVREPEAVAVSGVPAGGRRAESGH